MDNSVYSVTVGDDDDYEVIGVFSSEEKADYFVDNFYVDSGKSLSVIEEWVVDEFSASDKEFIYKITLLDWTEPLEVGKDKDSSDWFVDFIGFDLFDGEVLNSLYTDKYVGEIEYYVYLKAKDKDAAMTLGQDFIKKHK